MLRNILKNAWLIGILLTIVACSPLRRQMIAYQIEGQIWVMSPDGGQQSLLVKTNMGAAQPKWSPNGNSIAFTGIWPDGKTAIWLADFNGGNVHQVSPRFDSISAIWLNPDMLLTTVITDTGQMSNNPQSHFVLDLRDGTMREYAHGPESVVPFPRGDHWLAWNPVSWGLTLYSLDGRSQQIFLDYGLSGPTAFDISPSGEEIVFQGRKHAPTDSPTQDRLFRAKINANGQSEPEEILALDCCVEIHWSPDAKWIAVLDQTGQFHIIDASTNQIRITFQPGFLAKSGGTFQWSPDSQFLLVEALNYGTPGSNNILELAKIDIETGTVTRLTNNDKIESSPDWQIIQQ